MTKNEFMMLVKEMRQHQKTYFKTHSIKALNDSKNLERQVDKALEELLK